MTRSNDFFCPVPWISYAIRSDGYVRVCCHANQSPSKGVLLKDDDTFYSYSDDIIDTRNSKVLKRMRLNFLNKEWPEECIRCKQEHEANVSNRCIFENQRWGKYITKDMARRLTKSDGSINNDEIPLRFFDIRFGNLCNMTCRMCSPTDCDKWYKEWNEILGYPRFTLSGIKRVISKDENGKHYLLNDPFQWHNENIFWDNLKIQMSNMRLCYLVGGEPLLIKKHYDFLRDCVSMDHAKDITIDYNTNLSILPKYAFPLWNEFKTVNFGVSVDGIEKYNDYIRYPSKWKNIEKNLHVIDELGSNVNMWLASTIMVYNILHLPDLLEWRLSQNFKKIKNHKELKIISNHPLHTPNHLCIKIFPEESKETISELLNERLNQFEYDSKYPNYVYKKYKSIIDGYIRFMYQSNTSHLIQDFWWFNDRIDQSRNQKLDDYIPWLRGLLND